MEVFTIGYSGRTLSEFIDSLRSAGVTAVVDVRELPLSRKRGFSKTALRDALEQEGIEYIHVRAAGNPHRKLKADIEVCLRLYSDYLDEHPEVIDEVQGVVRGRRATLLCAEAEAHGCHRSVITSRLKERSPRARITHL